MRTSLISQERTTMGSFSEACRSAFRSRKIFSRPAEAQGRRSQRLGRGRSPTLKQIPMSPRDDDQDGVREVHCNTCEGVGAALRTSLRAFRGVHKQYLHLYVATYEAMANAKRGTSHLIRRMCGYPVTAHKLHMSLNRLHPYRRFADTPIGPAAGSAGPRARRAEGGAR